MTKEAATRAYFTNNYLQGAEVVTGGEVIIAKIGKEEKLIRSGNGTELASCEPHKFVSFLGNLALTAPRIRERS